MKRVAVLVLAAALLIAVYTIVAFAQGGAIGSTGVTPEGAALALPDPGMEMFGGRIGPMPLAARTAMAVSDSSLFVVSGGLLLKYDHNLNLLSHTELPMAAMGQAPGAGGGGGRGGRGGRGGGRRGGGL